MKKKIDGIPREENDTPLLNEQSKNSTLGKISLFISIVAGILSIIYYIYGIYNSSDIHDTIIIKAVNTEKQKANQIMNQIIQNSKDISSNQSDDIYIGKIGFVDFSGSTLLMYNSENRITLKINNIFSIKDNKEIKSVTNCQLDSIGKRYFQDGKESNQEHFTIPGKIRLFGGETIGYKFRDGKCDIFQIGSIEIRNFTKSVEKFNTQTGTRLHIGNIEGIGDVPYYNTQYHSGPWYHSLYSLGTPNELYTQHPYILLSSIYMENNENFPVGLLACKLDGRQAGSIFHFATKGEGNILENKDRIKISIEITGSGTSYEFMDINNGLVYIPPFTRFTYFEECRIHEIKLLDSTKEEIIDSITLQ